MVSVPLSKFISLTNTLWGFVLKTLIGCDVFGVCKLMEVVRDTSVATIRSLESSSLNGVLTQDIYATAGLGALSVAVTTGDPARNASFNCLQLQAEEAKGSIQLKMTREPSLSLKTADDCNNSCWPIRPIEVMGLIPVKGLTSSGLLYCFISAVTKTFKQESVDFFVTISFMYRHIDIFKINLH